MPPSQSNGSSAAHGRRSSHPGYRKRLVSRSSQRLILAISLVASLIALVAVITLALVKIGELKSYTLDLQARLENARKETAQLRTELDRSRAELAALVKDRLPYLMPLEVDRVTPIHEGYLKNIVFSRIRKGQHEVYEYKIVLENTADDAVQPDFRVMIFDRFGIQIGLHEVRGLAELPPGESTSHYAAVGRFMDRDPAYFAVTPLAGEARPRH